MVKLVQSSAELQTLLLKPLVMLKFSAEWCGPCKAVAPLIEKMVPQFPQVTFAEVDVDRSQDIASHYKVTAMPTFVFLRNGTEVNRVVGGSITQVTSLLRDLAASASTFSGSGQRVGSSSAKSSTLWGVDDVRAARTRTLAGSAKANSSDSTSSSTTESAKSKKPVIKGFTHPDSSNWSLNGLLSNLVHYFTLYIMTLFSFDSRATAAALERSP